MMDIHSPNVPESLAMPFGMMEQAFRQLTNLVRDMAPDALEFKGPEGVNSTAMLLRHLAYVDLGYLHEIMGKEVPQELEETYGPYETEQGRLPEITRHTATELLERYQRVLDLAREYFQTLSEQDATREVKVGWWGRTATVRFVLWHMASHSMIHQGQIARLQAAYKQA